MPPIAPAPAAALTGGGGGGTEEGTGGGAGGEGRGEFRSVSTLTLFQAGKCVTNNYAFLQSEINIY